MVTLFASVIGFLGSIFPDILRISRDKLDKKHELDLFDKQIEMHKITHADRLQYIDAIADISEFKHLHNNFYSKNSVIDSLNSSVRPVLAYSFFILYGIIKFLKYQLVKAYLIEELLLETIWNQEDQAIFVTIISFYFGQRALIKFRGKR